MKLVVALGGNALLRPEQEGTYEELVDNVKLVCKQVRKLVDRGHLIALTHGNGPQVGDLALQQAATSEVPENPLHVLDAMTQGEIGYLVQRELGNLLRSSGSKRQVVSLITQVQVASDDPSFKNPSKPIGPFYTEEEAKREGKKKNFVMKRVGKTGRRRYRRVVPSPEPVRIVEADVITKMLGRGVIVIAGGGGGIPVARIRDSIFEGVDAVIDKDLCAEKIAEAVGADVLLIITNVDKVKVGYATHKEKSLDCITVSEAKNLLSAGEFPPGSMGPKVTACIRFVEQGGRMGVISSIGKVVESLEGKGGTKVVPDTLETR